MKENIDKKLVKDFCDFVLLDFIPDSHVHQARVDPLTADGV